MPRISKTALVLMVCCSAAAHSYGQASTNAPDVSKAPVKVAPPGERPIKGEISFGYRQHTDGWSLYMDLGSIKAKNKKMSDMFWNARIIQVEFSEKKHAKQEKTVVDENATGNQGSYIYGKINNFYGLKAGVGFRKLLAGKPDPGSVSIHWCNIIGPSLGMLKPYYLNVYSDPEAIRYSDNTRPNFLNQRYIIGSAGFGKGLDEMKMIPGGHFKSMLHFDFSANRKSVVAVETGVAVEYYAEPIPLMFNQKAEPYFVNIFMAFQFGKRW